MFKLINIKEIFQKFKEEAHYKKTKKAIRLTQIVIIIICALLLMFNFHLIFGGQEPIGEIINKYAMNKFFVITWIWGILASHLFLTRKEKAKKVPDLTAISMLLMFSVLIFLLGLFIEEPLPWYMHIVLLVFGGVAGFFLWPQTLLGKEVK